MTLDGQLKEISKWDPPVISCTAQVQELYATIMWKK